MSGRFQNWWQLRTGRERGLLILLALIAAPILFYYGLARPIDRGLDHAQQARDAEARNLADVLLMAGKVRSADRPSRDPRQIDALLQAEAEHAGFTVASIGRDGDGALLTIDAVRAQPFFAWVATMDKRRGLIVTRLVARPNGDATLSVSARFQRAR